MTENTTMLHLLCGKICAGKSTLAAKLGAERGTVVIAEDRWLGILFADQMAGISDYVRCAAKLRQVIGPHVVDLLNAQVSVVLDFPANTVETRNWMREILEQTTALHQLHVLEVPDTTGLARLHDRNARAAHPFAATEQQYWQISKHFVPPAPEEGFVVVRHGDDGSG